VFGSAEVKISIAIGAVVVRIVIVLRMDERRCGGVNTVWNLVRLKES